MRHCMYYWTLLPDPHARNLPTVIETADVTVPIVHTSRTAVHNTHINLTENKILAEDSPENS